MKTSISWFAIIVLLSACQSSVSHIPPTTRSAENHLGFGNVPQLTNSIRMRAGLGPLRQDMQLQAAAVMHGQDLGRSGRFSHSGTDGSDVGDRVLRQGYRFCAVAENIASGQHSAGEVMQDWMQSPGHRRNILDSDVRDIGVARVGDIWVMVLGVRC